MATISEHLPYDLRYVSVIQVMVADHSYKGWMDITPVPQDDPANAMCAIAYEPEYQLAMDAFRYILAKQEMSQRALKLTEVIIKKNPGMFTVWNYRSTLLTTMPDADLADELDFMEGMMKVHLKGYQVWQHRKIIVLAMKDPSRELSFCSNVLAIDAKNYHTWQYRHWVLCHFYGPQVLSEKSTAIWDGELSYTEGLLADDIRNNSAWNHRYFVCFESGIYGNQVAALADREVEFVWEKLKLAPNNASPWNYLRGVLRKAGRPLGTQIQAAHALKNSDRCALAIEFQADAYTQEASKDASQKAAELFDRLSNELDPIRAPYYSYRKSKLSLNQ